MTYIENIFICMVTPLLVAAFCMGKRPLRFFLFAIAGLGMCLCAAYINTFLAAVYQANALTATQGIFGAMLLREDAGSYVLVGVVCFTLATVITALCFRLRNKAEEKAAGQ